MYIREGSVVVFDNYNNDQKILLLEKDYVFERGCRRSFYRLIDIFTKSGYGIGGYTEEEVFEDLRNGVKKSRYKNLRIITNGNIFEIKETI